MSREVSAGDFVCFRLADILSPGLEEALNRLTGHTKVVGRIVVLSDAGERKGKFAIIEAEGVLIPLIVPTSQLSKMMGLEPAQAAGLALANRSDQRDQ